MRFLRRRRDPGSSGVLVSVVVPVYNVGGYLPEALDSLLAQSHRRLDIVVVDDGSTDESGRIADEYAVRDPRIRVLHTANAGLGAARNEGLRHARGEYVGFVDSDDVVPSEAYEVMVAALESSGSDFVSCSFDRWEDGGLHEPPWMRRLHSPARTSITADDHPEILGDVFAWDKLFRRTFWERARLSWPEGIRYEDQPCTTVAFLRGRFDVLPDRVYRWRIRTDGSSITQQRSAVGDLRDRVETKRMTLAAVRAEGSAGVREMFVDRVLAGDMWRYFSEIPGASDEWWSLLQSAVSEFWGSRSLVHSGLPPVHRLTGWLVEQDRRADASAVMTYVASLGPARPGGVPIAVPRVADANGRVRLDVPVLDLDTVDPAALALRDFES